MQFSARVIDSGGVTDLNTPGISISRLVAIARRFSEVQVGEEEKDNLKACIESAAVLESRLTAVEWSQIALVALQGTQVHTRMPIPMPMPCAPEPATHSHCRVCRLQDNK
jgi:hypothetical protein